MPEKRSQPSMEELDRLVVEMGSPAKSASQPRLQSAPLLAAVCRAGTSHIYADTADVGELGDLISAGDGAILREVDGNTANQPLVHKVIARYLEGDEPRQWARRLREQHPGLSDTELAIRIYAIVCGRIGNDAARAFGAGRPWEVSLQIHMRLADDLQEALRIGRDLRRMVPSCVVKVPFTPHQPHCFLVARQLEREGIPVNFTSTFSARQTVVAAMLADVTLTNIFMGRLNQGLKAELLGEHVDLEAQRALLHARREDGAKTLLIVASVRDWQTFPRVAGCDVYTAPCSAIRDFLQQKEIGPADVHSQLETSYEDRLGIAPEVESALGRARIARLYEVEPELFDFLRRLRSSRELESMRDGEALYKRFDEAGFGDLFHCPDAAEWQELRKNKLPDLASERTRRLPLDTHYTLLADADFDKYQEQMDDLTRQRIA